MGYEFAVTPKKHAEVAIFHVGELRSYLARHVLGLDSETQELSFLMERCSRTVFTSAVDLALHGDTDP